MNSKKTLQPNTLPVEVHRKPYQRSLKVRVNASGIIQVYCSVSTKEADIRRFLDEARPFLKRSYRKLFELRRQLPHPFSSEFPWIPWMGQKLPLILEEQKQKPRLEPQGLFASKAHFELKSLQQVYKAEAEKLLPARVNHWAHAMNLRPEKVVLRGQKSRWGSCSAKGVINLNWKILIAPLDVIDYLVVHELSHLRHRHHGPAFWKLVAQFQPEYKTHEKWLRDNQHLAEFLNGDSDFYKTSMDQAFIEKLFDL